MEMTEEEMLRLEELSRHCLSVEVVEQTVKRLTSEVRRLQAAAERHGNFARATQTEHEMLAAQIRALQAEKAELERSLKDLRQDFGQLQCRETRLQANVRGLTRQLNYYVKSRGA